MQQAFCLFAAGPFRHRDQSPLGHQFLDRRIQIFGKTDIAVGQDADQFLGPLGDNGNAADPIAPHQFQCLSQCALWRDRDRVYDHAAFKALNHMHFMRLFFGCHILVDNADTALLCHGNRQGAFGHRIHGRRNQRNSKADCLGKLRTRIGLCWQNFRVTRLQKDIIKSQGFSKTHGSTLLISAFGAALYANSLLIQASIRQPLQKLAKNTCSMVARMQFLPI